MKNENIYDKITNSIIEQLEGGIIPWQKPWVGGHFMGCVSHTTGRPYSLLNQWLLEHRAGEWLTFNQIQAEGGRIKKGEKASFVVFWKFIDKTEKDEEGNTVIVGRYPILKGYNVFHIDQCEGITPKHDHKNEETRFEHTPIESAEKVALDYINREGIRLEIEEGGDDACYSPLFDRVRMPKIDQFKLVEQYYSTLFHELTHSTGHEKRLAREGVVECHFFGSESYSKEELVAEMGAAFMCQTLGINSDSAFNNSAAYVQNWLKQLRNDKKLVVAAAAKAEQAVQFILTGKKPSED